MTDDELADDAEHGMGGNGAIIEMLRRQQNRFLNRLMIGLSVIGVILALLPIFLQGLALSVSALQLRP